MPMNYMSGVSGPQWGMPMCGTPIGLPGPPSVPFGIPAGLQKQVIVNHTHVCVAKPTESERIDVKQTPGMSYPAADHHVRIVEHAAPACGYFKQPLCERGECADSEGKGQAEVCPKE